MNLFSLVHSNFITLKPFWSVAGALPGADANSPLGQRGIRSAELDGAVSDGDGYGGTTERLDWSAAI